MLTLTRPGTCRRLALVAASTVVAALALTACSVPGVYVVESKDHVAAAGSSSGSAVVEPKAYVAKVWDKRVLPTVTDKAVDGRTLLDAIKADPTAAGTKYGRVAGTGSAPSFLVKGTGRVISVTRGAAGQAGIDVSPPDGKADLSIALGPVFLGTALRDAVGFIDFSQFANQIAFADVASALNDKVRADVVKGLTPAKLKGKDVTFAGAFQLLDAANIVVTPVSISVGP